MKLFGAGPVAIDPVLCVDFEMPQSLPKASAAAFRQYESGRSAGKLQFLRLLPILLVFYSFLLLPPEVEVTIFDVNLPSYRIALLAVSALALWNLLQRGVGPLQFMDLTIMVVGFWTLVSFTVNYGFGVGMVRGIGILIDTILAYFAARTCIRSLDDLRYFLILVLPALIFAGSFLVLESAAGRIMLRPAFASVFGSQDAYAGGEASGSLALTPEYRIGLMRAFGPFPHPILAGIVMIGFLPLYYFSGLRSWPLIGGVGVTLTGFFSLSSAAFLALLLSLGVIVIYHVKAYMPKISWWTISGLLALLLISLQMASKSGIIPIIARLTLNPHSAMYRMLIWEHGATSVAKHPWFGIGYRQWDRPAFMGESVDAHFLLLAMRHGLIVPIVMLVGVIYGLFKLGTIIPYLSLKDRVFCIGINICVVIFVMVGQTVNYFGSANLVLLTVFAFLASAVSWGNQQMLASKRMRMMQYARMVAHRMS
jgi:O-Antigen ligase